MKSILTMWVGLLFCLLCNLNYSQENNADGSQQGPEENVEHEERASTLPLNSGFDEEQADTPHSSTPNQSNPSSQPLVFEWPPTFAAKDSYAQWLMTVFSLVATVVSAYAVRLLKLTLDETRTAARAAQDSVATTLEMMKQDRAWLSIHFDGGEGNPSIIGNLRDPVLMNYGFAIRNSGRSPAVEYRAVLHAVKYTNGEPDEKVSIVAPEIIAKMRSASPSYLPGGSHMYRVWRMDRDTRIEFLTGTKVLIYICCQYKTIYGEEFLVEQVFRSMHETANGVLYCTFADCGDRSHIARVNPDGTYSHVGA